MFILDLKPLLFGVLLITIAALFVALWVDRRLRRRPTGHILAPRLGELDPVLEHVPFGLLLLEGPRIFRYANPFARRLLGIPITLECHLPEAAWARLLDADRAAVRQEKATFGRYRSVPITTDRPDGSNRADNSTHFIRWWVSPLGDLDLVFLLDVTTQQRAEEAARSLINDLSHELRTPLATILTHLEVLSLPRVSQEIRGQSIQLLKTEAQRMSRLVNLMLELGRLETSLEIERRPVDLLALVEELVAQLNPQAEERGIVLSIEANAPLPVVLGDGDRLRQVFLNLLDNALKYARPGDRAVISLGLEDEGIRCVVRDTGPGIPARHLPNVTRRFYRAAPQEIEGSGLGLA
ncbi:MAG: ATP-binding protein, partial [Dehalococcoidales bacterium]|nr:ATP-binding protein [Dehalococcoidales bacterium]